MTTEQSYWLTRAYLNAQDGNKIAAIKNIRDTFGLSLPKSKAIVDFIMWVRSSAMKEQREISDYYGKAI